mmetsp:Transcript_5567/g.4764  ORF Transcript_5567/g.4764 Transcript_5567/m.4764 type:complete len:86 (-) Transcript_5567:332-589(-)
MLRVKSKLSPLIMNKDTLNPNKSTMVLNQILHKNSNISKTPAEYFPFEVNKLKFEEGIINKRTFLTLTPKINDTSNTNKCKENTS